MDGPLGCFGWVLVKVMVGVDSRALDNFEVLDAGDSERLKLRERIFSLLYLIFRIYEARRVIIDCQVVVDGWMTDG